MILALALAMVLLVGAYFFVDVYMVSTKTGRDVLEEGTIARQIAARISADISAQLGPRDTRVNDYTGGASSANSNSSTPSSDSTTPTTTPPPIVTYNTGIYGKQTYLVLSSYRVQKPNPNNPTSNPEPEGNSDLRRTYYWLVNNGSDSVGLARYEMKACTSMDADTTDPTTFPEQEKYVFAPEVKNILFEYFDGNTWQPEWDGTITLDTSQPTGAPRAIRITITLKSTLSQVVPDGTTVADGPIYQQIIALQTSDSYPPPPTTP
jgi:hypothetical protein